MIRTYYLLTKPGIILGNLITTTGAFALGSKGHIDFPLFLATAVGLFFVIASACVFNNYIDREADQKMARTKNRALAKGTISTRNALLFAIALGLIGALVLALMTNLLALCVALGGFFIYVVLYSLWKYRTHYATLVGSIAGAVPPVVGYCAASHQFDFAALLLFLILVLWQMPHFFSIAMYRFDDYAAASIPILPSKQGVFATKVQMLLYTIAFLIAAVSLSFFGYTGTVYLVIASILGIAWIALTIAGFQSDNDRLWARAMFRLSLVIILALSITISLDSVSGYTRVGQKSGIWEVQKGPGF